MGAPLFAFLLILMCLGICALILGWVALCFWVGERRSWPLVVIVAAAFTLPVVGLYFVILYEVSR